jgi:hypothetical protein
MRAACAVVWVVTTACGRLGFDPVAPDVFDAPRPVDAAPALLPCSVPTSSAGAVSGTADQLVVIAQGNELVALTTDNSQVLRSWTFAISDTGGVVPGAMGASVATDATGTLAIAPFGTSTLAAWSTPSTAWSQLDPAGQGIGMLMTLAQAPASGAVAASGVDGTLALLTIGSNGEVDGVRLDTSGALNGAPVAVVAAAVGAQSVRISPAATGYAITYTDPRPAVATREVMLLDGSLATVAGPVAASTDPYDAEDGQVAWAPASNTYLAAWGDKTTTADEVSFRVFDAQLTPLASTATVLESGVDTGGLQSDGQGFWTVTEASDELRVDRITATGAVTAQPAVPVMARGAAVAMRAGQPVVAWLSQGMLSVEGLCAD